MGQLLTKNRIMSFVAIAVVTTVASTALSVYSQQAAASAAEDAAEYNAKIQENEAKRKELENHETTNRMRSEKRRAKAQAFAKLAASGAALGEGSSLDVMEVLDARLETQIQDAGRAAQLESRALRQGAEQSRYSGEQQSAALKLQSYGTLLDGVSSSASKYSTYKSNKKPGKTSNPTLFG